MVVKDEQKELPIPVEWRQTLYAVAGCLVKNDYQSISKIPLVSKLPETTSIQINSYIKDYGEELISLPEDVWDSSVYIWQRGYWDVLVDLWTRNEGHSDLVLSVRVYQEQESYRCEVQMVCVF
ncbi:MULTISPECIES: hypothetical protein [unclassified Pseudoalteromonas]|uniref:DUF7668 domain-containing protein n=1 Tax=unclassified Pseudoalteromonas TaxID=194690 RepID=UPI00110AF62F|nr:MULTISPECIES: hypothetical protein [unclassified Pseudoalteromonas]TMP48422.1 hypothetical protein CWB80_03925 [Pseudoalteromonas sp. S1650]TMP66512.1 hypothetical protein CWB79_11640 [Pseudoalteromonas sp. S1649]